MALALLTFMRGVMMLCLFFRWMLSVAEALHAKSHIVHLERLREIQADVSQGKLLI